MKGEWDRTMGAMFDHTVDSAKEKWSGDGEGETVFAFGLSSYVSLICRLVSH